MSGKLSIQDNSFPPPPILSCLYHSWTFSVVHIKLAKMSGRRAPPQVPPVYQYQAQINNNRTIESIRGISFDSFEEMERFLTPVAIGRKSAPSPSSNLLKEVVNTSKSKVRPKRSQLSQKGVASVSENMSSELGIDELDGSRTKRKKKDKIDDLLAVEENVMKNNVVKGKDAEVPQVQVQQGVPSPLVIIPIIPRPAPQQPKMKTKKIKVGNF